MYVLVPGKMHASIRRSVSVKSALMSPVSSVAALQHRVRGFRLAAIQLQVTSDPVDNLKRAAKGIAMAASEGASMVALPECFVGSYGVEHFAKWAEVPGEFGGSAMMSAAARDAGIHVVGGIIEADEQEGCLFNTILMYGPDGGLAAKYRKVHLSRVMGITSESDVLAPGDEPVAVTCEQLGGASYRTGLACCFDLRFPALLGEYGPKGSAHGPVDVIVAPSAFLDATGRDHWELLLRRTALDNQTFVLAPNMAFMEDDKVPLHGRSMVVGPWGDILAECEHAGDGIAIAEASFDRLADVRAKLPLGTAARWP
jgi:predicted amidohydrolase